MSSSTAENNYAVARRNVGDGGLEDSGSEEMSTQMRFGELERVDGAPCSRDERRGGVGAGMVITEEWAEAKVSEAFADCDRWWCHSSERRSRRRISRPI